MNLKYCGFPIAIFVIGAMTLSSCAANENGQATSGQATSTLSGTINGIGSSAQGAAQTAWAALFQTENPRVTVNYDPQGSGAGRTNFIAGAANFAGSDAPLKESELGGTFAGCAPNSKAIDLPVYVSPIAIVYNVAGVGDLKLDAPVLARIFKGAITKWSDPAIAQLNPGTSFPDGNITVVRRSDDSGTTQNFSEYLKVNAPEQWDAAVSQTYPYPVGDGAKGTAGVVDSVKNGVNTIAYADESGVGSLAKAQLKVGDTFNTISAAGAADVVSRSPIATGRAANDLAVTINRADTAANAWPLVLVSYLIVCQNYADPSKGALVKAYASSVIGEKAQKTAEARAGSAPLSPELSRKAIAAVSTVS